MDKNCKTCTAHFTKPYKESQTQWRTRLFCSRKCSALHRAPKMVGSVSPMRGRSHTEEAKEKNRVAHLGAKSFLWKGGVSKLYGYRSHKNLERYALLAGSEGSFSLKEWEDMKQAYNHACAMCKSTHRKLTKDHKIPLTKGGSNYISNIQPLCQSCNSRKGNRLTYA